MKKTVGLPMAAMALAGVTLLQAAASDWPQWRGPNRTGLIEPEQAPAAWPAQLAKGWSVAVGEGYSSPVAADGRIFVHSRRDPEEVVTALDLATGKVLWEQSPAPVEKNPYAKQMAKGPYSTPLVAGGRLYAGNDRDPHGLGRGYGAHALEEGLLAARRYSFYAIGQLDALVHWRTAVVLTAAGPAAAWLLCYGLLRPVSSLSRGAAHVPAHHHWRAVAQSADTLRYVVGYACHTWELFAVRA